jgi:hypothetical protein
VDVTFQVTPTHASRGKDECRDVEVVCTRAVTQANGTIADVPVFGPWIAEGQRMLVSAVPAMYFNVVEPHLSKLALIVRSVVLLGEPQPIVRAAPMAAVGGMSPVKRRRVEELVAGGLDLSSPSSADAGDDGAGAADATDEDFLAVPTVDFASLPRFG